MKSRLKASESIGSYYSHLDSSNSKFSAKKTMFDNRFGNSTQGSLMPNNNSSQFDTGFKNSQTQMTYYFNDS